MTVTTVAPSRAVIDLGADATVLDAAARIAASETAKDVVLVVPAGAPLVRNAVFLDVLRRRAADRRLVIVSPDARARSLAASVHLRAFASLHALERHEMDATERLGQARRTALATIAAAETQRAGSLRRSLAVFACLVGAAAILFAVVAPNATVTVAAATSPIGPFEYDLRAGPGGDIQATTLPATLTRKFTMSSSGSRLDQKNATGTVQFSNFTTNELKIPKGTVVQTPDGIKFQTDADRTLPASAIFPQVKVATVDATVTAISPGPRGNVAAGRITQSGTILYSVTNPQPTTGGEENTIPIVTQADYDKAIAGGGPADKALADEADAQVAKWKTQESAKQRTVYPGAPKRTSVTPASEVLGKEVKDFELTVTGTLTAYSVANGEPRQTALQKLADQAPENDIDRSASAKVDQVLAPTVDDTAGVRWRVRASSVQFARADRAQLSAALAGRSLDEAAPIVSGRGFRVVQVVAWPSWWPRLPVLDSRITIDVAPAVTVASP